MDGAFLIIGMKAAKRFYGNSGKWYDYGDDVLKEDEKGLPKGFLEKEATAKKVEKVSKKVSTKNAAPKTEDK